MQAVSVVYLLVVVYALCYQLQRPSAGTAVLEKFVSEAFRSSPLHPQAQSK